MAHAAGDAGWVAWTNGVDTSIAGRTTPTDVDTKIATQHTADNASYAPVAEPIGAAAQTTASAAIPATQKGAASGVATLDSGGIVPAAQLPAASGGAWTSYTPALTQSGARTSTANYAKYSLVGKTLVGNVALTATQVGVVTQVINVSAPLSMASSAQITVGSWRYQIASSGVMRSGAVVLTGGLFWLSVDNNNNWFGFAPSAAIAVNDTLTINFCYEIP